MSNRAAANHVRSIGYYLIVPEPVDAPYPYCDCGRYDYRQVTSAVIPDAGRRDCSINPVVTKPGGVLDQRQR
jgi:hypothetical protein